MDSEELLAQLADIHLPTAVSYWPPAPGWWILAILLIAALVYFGRKIGARIRLRKICEQALLELDKCYRHFDEASQVDTDSSKLRYLNEVNSVIRRVALYHFPDSKVASLGGSNWVEFIREKGDSSQLDASITQALSFGRFQTECEVDIEALNQFGQQWITSLYLGSGPELGISDVSEQQGLST